MACLPHPRCPWRLRDSATHRTDEPPCSFGEGARRRALLSSVSKPSRSFGLSVSGAVSPSAPGEGPVSPARAATGGSATGLASIHGDAVIAHESRVPFPNATRAAFHGVKRARVRSGASRGAWAGLSFAAQSPTVACMVNRKGTRRDVSALGGGKRTAADFS